MTILKMKDIRGMNANDLNSRLKDLRLELIKSRSQKAQGTAMKTKEIKKAIARILTHQNKLKN